MSCSSSGSAEINAIRTLLAAMDIDPSGVVGEADAGKERPTFAEYLPEVEKAVSESSARVYAPYWRRLIQAWGGRKLDEPSASEIKQLAWRMKDEAVARRNTRGGRSAAEHFVGAVRCIYSHAESDGLIDEAKNPARRVAKPRRLPSTRRALPSSRVAELNKVASTTGNDPDLDALLLRLHMETACRRGGALAVRPRDLDVDQCLVLLREKGETVRWQPVSPTLMRALQEHVRARGDDDPGGQLLRYVGGAPISRRRYDHLWHRLGRHLPWVSAQQITTHWLRHTTLTWVERHFGYAVAREFAGHAVGSGDGGATATYVRADLHEVATALAALTGEPHPLAEARR